MSTGLPAVTTVTIVQTAFLGDVLLALPLAIGAAHCFPGAERRMVVTPAAAGMIDGLSVVDRVIAYDKRGADRGARGLEELARSSRSTTGHHVVLVPHASVRTARFVRMLEADTVVTFRHTASRRLATHVIDVPPGIHDADRQCALLRPFDAEPWTKERAGAIALYTQADAVAMESRLPSRPYVVLAPGSVWPTKRWPLHAWNRLAADLAERGWAVVVIGDGSVRGSVHGAVVDFCGETTMRESAYVVARAGAVVANDSAPLHLASLQRVPVVGIFGPTIAEYGFGPFGPEAHRAELTLACRPCSPHGRARCPLGTHHCLEGLAPSLVRANLPPYPGTTP